MPDDVSPEPLTPAAPPSPNQEYAQKIAELERQRADAVRAAQEDRDLVVAELQSVKDELARVTKKLDGEPVDPRNPLSRVKDEELDAVMAQGPEADPSRYHIAQEELWRRREAKVLQEAERRAEARLNHERSLAAAVDEMRRRYGDEIVKEGSELRTRAEMHMKAIQNREGREAAFDPKTQLRAAEMAWNDRLNDELKRTREAEKELKQYKERAQMERGNQVVAKPGDETNALLKKGKVDEAIKSLNLYHRLFGG